MKYCILVAGMPATGKSAFAAWLSQKRKIPFMSKDDIKEQLFDNLGFSCRAEKVALGNAAEDILYYVARQHMKIGTPFILENNFEDKSRDGILKLVGKYGYRPVTVLFDGCTDVIYQRFIARDQSPERHRGHVVNTQYPEIGTRAPYIPMTLEQFTMGMDGRGFRRFDIGGDTICVDTTDFAKVEYEKINAEIDYALSNV